MAPLVRQSLNTSVHYLQSGLAILNQLCKDPEFFQRIYQVAFAIFQGMSWYRDKIYFPKLTILLDVVNVNDFYDIFEVPYTILHSYSPNRIDVNSLLNKLESVVSQQNLGQNQNAIREGLQLSIQSFHKNMEDNDIAFSTAKDYKKALQKWLKRDQSVSTCLTNADSIDLSNVEITLISPPILKVIALFNDVICNTGCILYFLQEWKVVDLASKAASLGKFPLLSWVPQISLEQVIYGSLSVSYMCYFLESCRILHESSLTPEAARVARWDRTTSAAEFVFNFAALQNADPKIVLSLMFVAKMLGLASITDRYLRSRSS